MVAGCFWMGKALCFAGHSRAKTLSELTQVLRRLQVRMLEEIMPLQDALSSMDSPLTRGVAAQMRPNEPLDAAWKRAREALCRRGGMLDSLREEDLRVLDGLFENLGLSGRMDQRLLMEKVERELEELEKAARRANDEHGKLYGSLGALAGLALAVCIL